VTVTTSIARRPLQGGHGGHDHADGHHHDHDHGGGRSHGDASRAASLGEREPAAGAVVFDIGDGVGALIVRLDEHHAGTELPIEAYDDTSLHVHTGVWRRSVNGHDEVLAVFAELPAGRYGFPTAADRPGGEVAIVSGEIARLDLRAAS
jgi:hypothetical protein